jgi:hypothetical protein
MRQLSGKATQEVLMPLVNFAQCWTFGFLFLVLIAFCGVVFQEFTSENVLITVKAWWLDPNLDSHQVWMCVYLAFSQIAVFKVADFVCNLVEFNTQTNVTIRVVMSYTATMVTVSSVNAVLLLHFLWHFVYYVR